MSTLPSSSSLAFFVVLLVFLVSWLLAARGRKAFGWAHAISCLAPAVLAILVAGASLPRFGDLRVAVEGLRLHLDRLDADGVTVGGSRDDHLYVRGLPAGFVRIARGADGRVEILQTPGAPRAAGGHTFGVVRVDERRAFHGAVEIRQPVTLRLGDDRRLDFDPAAGTFTAAGEPLGSVPRRVNDVAGFEFAIGRQLPPEQIIYPLRFYGRPPGRDDEVLDRRGEPLGSFLYRERGEAGGPDGYLREAFFVALVDAGDSGVELEDGTGSKSFEPLIETLPTSRSEPFGRPRLHLALFRVDYHDPRTQVRDSRVQELRSFELRLRDEVLDVVLDTPGIVDLRRQPLDEMRRLRDAQDGGVVLSLVSRDMAMQVDRTQMALRFGFLGEPLTPELFSRIEAPAAGDHFKVTTHRGTRRYAYGDAFEIGDAAAVVARLDRLDPPWGALALVLILALAAVATTRPVREHSYLYFVLLSGVEMLVTLRLLIAYQAASLDPSEAEAVWRSAGALAVIPFALHGAVVLHAGFVRRPLIARALVCLPVLAWVLRESGRGAVFMIAAVVAAALAPVILWSVFLLLDRLPLELDRMRGLSSRQWWLGLGLAVIALVVVRAGTLLGLGWKERISLPGLGIVAVSVYYTPWVLAIFAWLWGGWLRPGFARRFAGVPFVLLVYALLAGLMVAFPALANDFGSILIFPLPVLLLFALPLVATVDARRFTSLLRDGLLALPLLVVLGVHLLLPLLLPLVPQLGPAWAADSLERARLEPAEAATLLEERLDADRNLMRLWNLAFPERLEEIGTTVSEGLLVVMANLRDYAARGPLGEGYLGVPLAPALGATHVDDNVSAVHLLGTFGWLGGLGVLLLLAGWAVAPLPLLSAVSAGGLPDELAPRHAFGLMVVWTFFAAGAYMLSANTQLLFFTGKNVYFLAASSLSDALEATLLAALALWAFRDVR